MLFREKELETETMTEDNLHKSLANYKRVGVCDQCQIREKQKE